MEERLANPSVGECLILVISLRQASRGGASGESWCWRVSSFGDCFETRPAMEEFLANPGVGESISGLKLSGHAAALRIREGQGHVEPVGIWDRIVFAASENVV